MGLDVYLYVNKFFLMTLEANSGLKVVVTTHHQTLYHLKLVAAEETLK
jgi:hypothetical protein